MDFEKKIISDMFKKCFREAGLSTIKDYKADKHSDLFDKDLQKSLNARKEANQLLTGVKHNEKVHEDIWRLYCKSIAFAPNNTEEVAIGYSNRSALLLHLKKYKDCLSDIDRALKITKSSALRVKLFCRQAECFTALQDGKQSLSLEKAKFWLSDINDHNEVQKLNPMVEKAEKIVDDDVSVDLEKDKKNQISCENDAVGISYDKQYGRYLTATRDIRPGEFVYVEEFYASSINISKLYAYCSHCLGISWSMIPCDQCAYYMFCSDECKNEAWEKYHSIECHARHVKGTHQSEYMTQLAIRSLIMGIKEAGSIEKLKDLVNEIDKCKNPLKKGFVNGQLASNSFRGLYSLSYTNNPVKVNYATRPAIEAFTALAKNTDIFGKRFEKATLYKSEDAIFLGGLSLRLILIFFYNSYCVLHMNRGCSDDKGICECIMENCCQRGTHISIFTSLINHSCSNNVDKFHTSDGKVVYYALKPIKKDSQIFSSYNTNFVQQPKDVRQKVISMLYDFKCGCVACKLNWPSMGTIKNQRDRYPDVEFSQRLMVANAELIKFMKDKSRPKPSRKIIRDFAEHVEVLFQLVKEPTFVTQMFHLILVCLMENRYCDVLKVPSTC